MSMTIRAGVIGTGGAGSWHAKIYHQMPDVELVAIAEQNEARWPAAFERIGAQVQAYKDYREMLARPDIDVVSIATPNWLHAPIAIDALRAGKHVLTEKPMATTVADGQAMVQAARDSGRILMVCFNYRYRADARYLKSQVSEGKMGAIYYARCGWLRCAGIPGGEGSWFVRQGQSGGGPLIDLGVHMLDLAMWLMGYPQARAVSGATFARFGPRGLKSFGGRHAPAADLYDVEDMATALIRMQDGSTLSVETSWASHTRPGRDDFYVHLYGDEGGAEMNVRNYSNKDTVRVYREENSKAVETRPRLRWQAGGHQEAIRHFVACARDGTAPESSGEQGLALLKIIDAIYRSAQAGEQVHFQSSQNGA